MAHLIDFSDQVPEREIIMPPEPVTHAMPNTIIMPEEMAEQLKPVFAKFTAWMAEEVIRKKKEQANNRPSDSHAELDADKE